MREIDRLQRSDHHPELDDPALVIAADDVDAVDVGVLDGGLELDDIVLSGMPIVYNTAYSVNDMVGTFRETMAPGVARRALAQPEADVRFLIDHQGMPLARFAAGTLVLRDTPQGLTCEAPLYSRQQAANDLAVVVERGGISQMSCGFVVADDVWGLDDEHFGRKWRVGCDHDLLTWSFENRKQDTQNEIGRIRVELAIQDGC